MGAVGERIRPKVDSGFATAKDKAGDASAKVGRGVFHYLTPTVVALSQERVQKIRGKYTRRVASALRTSAMLIEGSGLVVAGFGTSVSAPPVIVGGLGMYAAGRVPGVISEGLTRASEKHQRRQLNKKQ